MRELLAAGLAATSGHVVNRVETNIVIFDIRERGSIAGRSARN